MRLYGNPLGSEMIRAFVMPAHTPRPRPSSMAPTGLVSAWNLDGNGDDLLRDSEVWDGTAPTIVQPAQ